ncbi:hypothetical protein Pmani_008582 [Petrolisthes manimaculis]|uniref:Uncharacterized protein n=1 Tax=Petrolisthes manimaculis TaxID=1843537 RepID=A0AAE1Q6M5_9EUCA|nr:hypothetical protein Pmani_008582 [Petrolisthes manimaculis]
MVEGRRGGGVGVGGSVVLVVVTLFLATGCTTLVYSQDNNSGVGEGTTLGEDAGGDGGDEVKVLVLQASGKPSDSSYARLLTPFPELHTFTACYRIRLTRFREESTLMSYAVTSARDNELRMDHRITGYKVSLHSTWAQTNYITPLNVWSHFCFLFNHMDSRWEIYVNGRHQANGSYPVFNEPLAGAGAYVIGQEQDSFGGSFQRDQSFSGEITQLNFWQTELPQRTIAKMAACESVEEGDALGWREQEWRLEGEVTTQYHPYHTFCKSSGRSFTFFPNRFSLIKALHLCQVVGGILAVPQTPEENALVYSNSKDQAKKCSGNVGESYLWIGANDEVDERQWAYWGSGEKVKWEHRWRGSGPNGGVVENCLVMLHGENNPGYWSDIACLPTYAFCVPCEFEDNQVMHLKGPALCPGSPFNLQYTLGEERDGSPSLMGFFHTDIYWNNTRAAWIMQSLKVETATAFWSPPHQGVYPFGTWEWTLEDTVCGLESGSNVNFTLSVCGMGKFTCSDGSCISIDKRCDLRVDCPDKSDENLCDPVEKPPNYQMNIPPPSKDNDSSIDILFTINIISFPSVATEDLTFVTTFQLRLQWRDSRLNYINLKKDRTLNLLSPESKLSIWTPRVFFGNAHGNVFTNLNQGSRVECVQQGESVVGGPHLPKEMNIFSGLENSMEISQLYTVTYSCDFDLLMFPFDAQVCKMSFLLVSASSLYMKLVPHFANFTGRKNLIEYSIGKVTMTTATEEDEFSTVVVEVRFARRYGFYLLTLYIPTTLLILISYATLFFNPDDFNSRIVVALTSLLVLSQLYTQTSNSLPKTSYFKLVDVWLFFSIVMIFIVVMLQTLIDLSQQPILKDSKILRFTNRLAEIFCRTNSRKSSSISQLHTSDSRSNGIHIHVRSQVEADVTKHTSVEGWTDDERDTEKDTSTDSKVCQWHRPMKTRPSNTTTSSIRHSFPPMSSETENSSCYLMCWSGLV